MKILRKNKLDNDSNSSIPCKRQRRNAIHPKSNEAQLINEICVLYGLERSSLSTPADVAHQDVDLRDNSSLDNNTSINVEGSEESTEENPDDIEKNRIFRNNGRCLENRTTSPLDQEPSKEFFDDMSNSNEKA